jgi:predicted regulator of Ras-like GTPase activity (Roadblock/LC7/MglB family)
MYKLTFRIWVALVAVIVFGAAAYFSMKQFPSAVIGLPGAVIILAVLALPVLVAFIAFAKASMRQKLVVAAIGIAFGLVYGLAANINFGTTKLLPNFQLLINEYLLGIMALGGALTAFALCALKPADAVASAVKKSGPTEVVIPDKEEATPKTSHNKLPAQPSEPLTKNPASVSNTNLKGILDTLAPEDEAGNEPSAPVKTGLAGSLSGSKSAAPAPAKQAEPAPVTQVPAAQTPAATSPTAEAAASAVPSTTSPTDSQTNLAGQKKATTGTVASSTATRLQAQKRKSTSTFTKLQALSASGTGGIRPKPVETTAGDNEADSLKSILDRLDTKADETDDAYAAPDEVEMDSLFSQGSLLSPPEVADEPTASPEPPKPEPIKTPEPPKPATAAKPAEPAKPAAAAPKPATPAASSNPAAASKPASKQYDASPLAKKPEAPPSLSSMLDSLDAPAPKSSPSTKISTPGVLGASTTNSAAAKAPTPPFTPKPSMTSSSTPSKPAETPRASTPTSTPKPADIAKTVETPKPAAAKVEQPAAKPEVKPEPKPEVKPEPKQEVKPEPKPEVKATPKPAEPPKPVAKEPIRSEPMKEEPGLFETGLDKEIDDIFSNLVPAEAQKNVETKESKSEPAAKVEAAPERAKEIEKPAAEAEKPKEGGVFESTKIDQELDDIFSNLVPAEAQKEVAKTSAPAKPADKAAEAKTVETKKPEEKDLENKKAEEPKAVVEEKKPEPKSEPKPEPVKSEGMFEESGLDRELDDIFSNLAPSEAQRSVTHETLAKVRAADATGDHPAITPDNVMRSRGQEEMSFAPPSEEAETKNLQDESSSIAETSKSEDATESESETESASGKFTETLHAMPSLQATVEGLLNNLAASEPVKTESFAPPESKEPANGSGVADQVMNLLESLETSKESQAAQESAEAAAESASGDIVNDLFDSTARDSEREKSVKEEEDSRAEPNDELITEAVVEEAKEAEKEPAEATAKESAAETEADVAESTRTEETVAEETISVNETEEVVEAEKPTETVEVAEAEKPAETVEAEKPAEAAEAEKTAEAAESSETTEAASEAAETSKESEASRKTAKELKEFGRLSSKPGTEFQAETAGTMKTIGKLLLEVQAVENIIKAGESGTIGSGLTTARVISAARGEGIKALLSKIDSYSGVDGSIIVGHDGLVIASTAGPGMDKDTLGVLSVACLSSSNLVTKKLEIGKLRQMVLVTDAKTTVLTDVDVGILAVFLDNNDVGKIDGLREAIHDTIHG